MRAVPIGQYLPGDSILHRLDPRAKIVFVLLFSIALFAMNGFASLALSAALLVALAALGGVHLRALFRGLKPVLFLLAIAVIMNAFFVPGPQIKLAFLSLSSRGLRLGFVVAARLALLMLGTTLLTLTTTPIELTDGVERLLMPFRRFGMPAHELAMMMTIALRFIPTLMDEADKLIKAQAARGADFESGNIVRRARSFIPVLVPLFVGIFRRADELASAMEARGYRGGKGRTRLRELKMQARDWLALSATPLILALLLAIDKGTLLN